MDSNYTANFALRPAALRPYTAAPSLVIVRDFICLGQANTEVGNETDDYDNYYPLSPQNAKRLINIQNKT